MKPGIIFSLIGILMQLTITAQIKVIPGTLNFGTTGPNTEWVVDVHISNDGDKKDYLLRHTFSHEYQVLFSSKTIEPDSTIVMRVKFQPRVKEIYHEKIELYFASMDKPVILPVYADVVNFNPEDHLPCPDFSRLAAECCTNNMFMVEVLDDETGKGIGGSMVRISEDGVERMKLKTNADGMVTNSVVIGYYRVKASHENYLTASVDTYLNRKNGHITIRLKKNKDAEKQIEIADVLLTDSVNIPVDHSILPENLYAPNNVVLLVDVSSSMAAGKKLELMKSAIDRMVPVLRPQDRITLVSYADEAKVLLATTGGDQKEVVLAIVNGLKADGSTSGEKGFKKSYEMLKKAYIKGGNNQLVVVTDGIFEPADQAAIFKLVKRATKKKMTTSVVGIQCASFAEMKLSEVSTLGNGSFLVLESEADLNLLIDELKRRSAK